MQCEEWADANSELFKEAHDETVHKNSYKRKLYELISASLNTDEQEGGRGITATCHRAVIFLHFTSNRRNDMGASEVWLSDHLTAFQRGLHTPFPLFPSLFSLYRYISISHMKYNILYAFMAFDSIHSMCYHGFIKITETRDSYEPLVRQYNQSGHPERKILS